MDGDELPIAEDLVRSVGTGGKSVRERPFPFRFRSLLDRNGRPAEVLPWQPARALLPVRALLILLIPFLFLLFRLPSGRPALLWVTLGLALASLPLAYVLKRRGLLEHRRVRWALPAVDLALTTLLLLGSCTSRSPFFPAFYLPIAYAGLLSGYGGGLGFGLAASGLYGLLYALDPHPAEPALALSTALLFPLAGGVSGYLGRTLALLGRRSQEVLEQARRLHREAEERRALYERWYRAVDRLKADFVYSAAHELRTPLTPVKGYLQLLRHPDFPISEEKRQEYMQIMAGNVDLLAQLVDDILYLQRVTRIPIDLEEVSLSEVARQAVEEVSGEAEENEVHIHLDDWAGLPPILGSGDSLKLVLSNLLEAAVRDSPDGSVVLLSLRPADAGIEVRIAGAGKGIPAEQQERLFDLFFHADSSPTYVLGREGLSLAVARYIVEMHGGRIAVENQPRGGMAFVVYLPGRPGQEASPWNAP
ncbi:MAG: sensor histidine kinase [Chloroflexia bacterium]